MTGKRYCVAESRGVDECSLPGPEDLAGRRGSGVPPVLAAAGRDEACVEVSVPLCSVIDIFFIVMALSCMYRKPSSLATL